MVRFGIRCGVVGMVVSHSKKHLPMFQRSDAVLFSRGKYLPIKAMHPSNSFVVSNFMNTIAPGRVVEVLVYSWHCSDAMRSGY